MASVPTCVSVPSTGSPGCGVSDCDRDNRSRHDVTLVGPGPLLVTIHVTTIVPPDDTETGAVTPLVVSAAAGDVIAIVAPDEVASAPVGGSPTTSPQSATP